MAKDPMELVNVCWVSSGDRVFVRSATTFIFEIYGFVCVRLTSSNCGDRKDIVDAHLIIFIISVVSTFSIVI